MANLYADENFNFKVVQELRNLNHDVLTAQEAGQARQKIPDSQVLTYATILGRAVLTHYRKDYIKLHKKTAQHAGIVVCTNDRNFANLALRTHQAIIVNEPLKNKLIRVNKPSNP